MDISKQQMSKAIGKISCVCFALVMKEIKRPPNQMIQNRKYSFSEVWEESEKLEFLNFMSSESKKISDSKILERILPRKFAEESLCKTLLTESKYSHGGMDLIGIEKAIQIPLYDLLDRGGKRWRMILCTLICDCFNGNQEEVNLISAACEIIHNGSLIADDIEDDSSIRRGKECLHRIYGQDVSINLSSFLYFASVKSWMEQTKLASEQVSLILKEVISEMTNIHIGQAWDLIWHREVANGKHEFPTMNQYLEMVSNKTGVLARLSASLTGLAIGISPSKISKLKEFACSLGVAFQIQDDILNLVGEKYANVKGNLGEDIHEGKISILVIHSYCKATSRDKERLLEILALHTNDQTLIQEAIDIIKGTNSIEICADIGRTIIMEAWRNVREIIPDSEAKSKLFSFAKFMVERQN